MLIETTVYGDLSLQWIREQRPDVAVVYFQSTDTIGHVFAPYAPPRQASIAQDEFDRYSAVPERFFRALDERIGQLPRRRGRGGRRADDRVRSRLLLGRGPADEALERGDRERGEMARAAGHLSAVGKRRAGQGGARRTGRRAAGRCDVLAVAGLPPGRDVNGEPLEGATPVNAPRADYAAGYQPASAQADEGGRAGESRGGRQPAIARLHRRIRERHGSARQPGIDPHRRLLQQRGRDSQGARQAAAGHRGVREGAGRRRHLASAQWNLSDVLVRDGPGSRSIRRAAGAGVRRRHAGRRQDGDRTGDRLSAQRRRRAQSSADERRGRGQRARSGRSGCFAAATGSTPATAAAPFRTSIARSRWRPTTPARSARPASRGCAPATGPVPARLRAGAPARSRRKTKIREYLSTLDR